MPLRNYDSATGIDRGGWGIRGPNNPPPTEPLSSPKDYAMDPTFQPMMQAETLPNDPTAMPKGPAPQGGQDISGLMQMLAQMFKGGGMGGMMGRGRGRLRAPGGVNGGQADVQPGLVRSRMDGDRIGGFQAGNEMHGAGWGAGQPRGGMGMGRGIANPMSRQQDVYMGGENQLPGSQMSIADLLGRAVPR